MTRKKYRLQPVLDVRDKEKKNAAQHLIICREHLTKEEEELSKRNQAVEDCRQQQSIAQQTLLETASQGTKAHKLIFHRNYINNLIQDEEELKILVKKQTSVVIRAEEQVEKAVEKLAEASKELKVIEKHKEEWQKMKKKELEKLEQKLTEEIGTVMYQQNQNKH